MDFKMETIAAAEQVLGVTYTDPERAMMLGNLAPQIENALRRRAMVFPNALAPATRFDPRLPGFRAPGPQIRQRWSTEDPGALPDSDQSIAFASSRG